MRASAAGLVMSQHCTDTSDTEHAMHCILLGVTWTTVRGADTFERRRTIKFSSNGRPEFMSASGNTQTGYRQVVIKTNWTAPRRNEAEMDASIVGRDASSVCENIKSVYALDEHRILCGL
jgi:hypothetical protein